VLSKRSVDTATYVIRAAIIKDKVDDVSVVETRYIYS
jgi:hypothetical protein